MYYDLEKLEHRDLMRSANLFPLALACNCNNAFSATELDDFAPYSYDRNGQSWMSVHYQCPFCGDKRHFLTHETHKISDEVKVIIELVHSRHARKKHLTKQSKTVTMTVDGIAKGLFLTLMLVLLAVALYNAI